MLGLISPTIDPDFDYPSSRFCFEFLSFSFFLFVSYFVLRIYRISTGPGLWTGSEMVLKITSKRGGPSPEINGIRVDFDALFSIRHGCRPELCGAEGSCCARYEICVEPEEVERVVGFMPGAARYAPGLLSGGRYMNVFDETEDGLVALDRDEDGLCVFAYRSPAGPVLCALHTSALELGIPAHNAKPRCCVLWPLALGDGKVPLLSVDEDAFAFPCNTLDPSPGRPLDPAIGLIVRDLFGPAFLEKLLAFGPAAKMQTQEQTR